MKRAIHLSRCLSAFVMLDGGDGFLRWMLLGGAYKVFDPNIQVFRFLDDGCIYYLIYPIFIFLFTIHCHR